MVRKAWLEGFGSCEIIEVPVANSETTVDVNFAQAHIAPVIFASANYLTGVIITVVTKSSCTLTFTDPTADKIISLLIIG